MKEFFKASVYSIIIAMIFAFTACSDDDETTKEITVDSDKTVLNQEIYADDTEAKSGVTFTTSGAWTSSIVEKSVATKATATKPASWVSISPDRGDKAGSYTISISLEPNYTGVKRSATIMINCNGDQIEVSVTQDGKTEEGKVPEQQEDKYDLNFLLLREYYQPVEEGDTIHDPNNYYTFSFSNELGSEVKDIASFKDTCHWHLSAYNETTKDVYIYRYASVASEVISFNTETKEQKSLAKDIPVFDQAYISANGQYIVYDKVFEKEDKQQIVKRSLVNGKEIVLSETNDRWGGASITSISKDGSIVILSDSNKVLVMEGDKEKYSFLEEGTDYVEAYLSPNEDKIAYIFGDSGVKICNIDGSDMEIIINNDSKKETESLLWSADGKYFYTDDYRKSATVYKTNIAEKNTEILTSDFPTDFLYNDALSIKVQK